MKFTELYNFSKFFHGHNTATEIYSSKCQDKNANTCSPGDLRNIKSDDKFGMDKTRPDTGIVKLASLKRSSTVKQNHKDKNLSEEKRTFSKLKVSASLKRLSRINLQSHVTDKTRSGTADTHTLLSLNLTEKANNLESVSAIYSDKTKTASRCPRDYRTDYKMPSFEVNKRSPSSDTISDALSPRIHTSMYLQQMICKDSQIVQESDVTSPTFNKHTLDDSNFHPADDLLFSFESPKCLCTMNLAPNLRLNLKKGELLGLGITSPVSRSISSHNTYFNSYLMDSQHTSPSTCKNHSYEILKPINKSSIIKSNRRPFKDVKNINVVDTQLLTPLKEHKRELFTNSMLNRSESMYSNGQNRQSKIQRRAQLDSKHHLTLAHSLNSNCTKNGTLENADIISIYDGLSAAEIQDYQKVKMWANY